MKKEQIITIAKSQTNEIVGLLIVEEFEFSYIKEKIIAYLDNKLKLAFSLVIDNLEQSYINIPIMREKLFNELNNGSNDTIYKVLEPYELKSDNKNKSSRNKRMIKQMKLEHLERCVFYVRKKDD